MELDEVIKQRRSIRSYKKEAPDISLIKQCIEAACQAPSAHNSQPWHFVIVSNEDKKKELAKTHSHTSFLKDAPYVVTVLADESKSSHYVKDCSAAVMLFLLKAAELGLGACWTDASSQDREDHIRKTLGLTNKYRVLCNIPVGYPDEEPKEKGIMSFEEATDVVE